MPESSIGRRKLLRDALTLGAAAGLAHLFPAPGPVSPRALTESASMSGSKAWIAGCAGRRLNREERAFFADERPFGFILFRRNIAEANQLSDLVAELKDIAQGDATPVFVDQEGGRIQRLRPPLAPNYPPAGSLGDVFRRDEEAGLRATWLHARLLAADLMDYGVNANCVPCLDVPVAGAHSVIGDRAYADDPAIVAALGRAAADGTMAGGVLPVMKHVPGHGRGDADSHEELPVVDAGRGELEAHDFPPFATLADLPAAMTAHLLYRVLDPARPATLSPAIIEDVIRGAMGFSGLLMTDDISMKALKGDFTRRAREAIDAGCDIVLHCNGDFDEMRAIAMGVPPIEGDSASRSQAAIEVIAAGAKSDDIPALREEFDERMAILA